MRSSANPAATTGGAKSGEKWDIAGIGYNTTALSTLRCMVVMVDVVVPVAIHRRSLDKTVAKDHFLS